MKKFSSYLMMAMLFTTAFAAETTTTVSKKDYATDDKSIISATATVATPNIDCYYDYDMSMNMITIGCGTEGADIYYETSEGHDCPTPTSESRKYTGPFAVYGEEVVVMAIAYKDGVASPVGHASFLFASDVPSFNSLDDNSTFMFTAPLTVTGHVGQYLYAQDGKAGILIYGQTGHTYKFGDVIPAGWTGTKITSKGAPQASNIEGLQPATTKAEVPIKVMTPTEAANLANFSLYGVIKNVTIDLIGNKLVAEDNSEIAIFDRFKPIFPELVLGKRFNVYVITGFNDVPLVFPVAFEEVKDTPTGINDISVNSAKVVKMIENGQVVIVKGDNKFNVAGQAIK